MLFFVKQKTAYEIEYGLVGSEMGIRDRSWDVAALCFEEDPRLDLAEFTQPAIVTAEVAMLRALGAEFGLSPTHFGGHSLGEYTALCAAGAIPFADALRLVRKRGALMQQAVPVGEGAMSAIVAPGVSEAGPNDVISGPGARDAAI